jgi:hypothetical protein
MYTENKSQLPNVFNLRGMPKILRQFDRPENSDLTNAVENVENLFVSEINCNGVILRYCVVSNQMQILCNAAYAKNIRCFKKKVLPRLSNTNTNKKITKH